MPERVLKEQLFTLFIIKPLLYKKTDNTMFLKQNTTSMIIISTFA